MLQLPIIDQQRHAMRSRAQFYRSNGKVWTGCFTQLNLESWITEDKIKFYTFEIKMMNFL